MFEYLTSQQKTNQILYMKLNFKSHSQFQLVITNSLTDSSVFFRSPLITNVFRNH